MPPKGKSGSGKGGKGRAAETIRERGVGKKKGGSRPAAMGVIRLAAGGQLPPPPGAAMVYVWGSSGKSENISARGAAGVRGTHGVSVQAPSWRVIAGGMVPRNMELF